MENFTERLIMLYIQKTKDPKYKSTGTFFVDEKTGDKYPQYTAVVEERHVVKMPCSTNIVLSDGDIEKLIPLLQRITDGVEPPAFEPKGDET